MERKKVLGILVLLSSLLLVPLLFGSSVGKMTGGLFSMKPLQSPGAIVFVDPANVVDSRLQASNSSTFTVDVNVTDVTDLFTWQINMTWDPSILNVNDIVMGEFLYRTDSLNKTSSASRYYGGLGFVMNITDDTHGYLSMAESILEDAVVGEVPGESGEGRLVSVEFLVVGYGWTYLNISLAGNLATTLLSSSGVPISFDTVDGWFDNRLAGDVNADGVVSLGDAGEISDCWTSPPGVLPYARYVDLTLDGVISLGDAGIVSDNWGKSI